MEQLHPGRAGLNIVAATRMRGRLAVPPLAAALDEIARRHAAWRTTFPRVPRDSGAPVQRVAHLPASAPVADRPRGSARRAAGSRGAPPGRRRRRGALRPRARPADAVEPDPPRGRRLRLPAHPPPPGDRLGLLPDRLGGARRALRRLRRRRPGGRPRAAGASRPLPGLRRLAARLAAGRGARRPGRLVARAARRRPARPRDRDRPPAPAGDADARRPVAGAHPRPAVGGAARPRPRRGGDAVHDGDGGDRGAAPSRLGTGEPDPRRQQRQPQPPGARAGPRLLPDPGAVHARLSAAIPASASCWRAPASRR